MGLWVLDGTGGTMPRPSIVQVTVVLLVALVGTMAIAAVQRVRERRAGVTATAATPATAAASADDTAARAAEAAPPLEARISVPDAAPAPRPEPTFSVARVKPGRTLALRSKP